MGSKRGFTLVEILTAITIFGILVSLTGYVYGISLARSRDNERLTDLNNIKNALEQYYLINKKYPYNTAYKTGFAGYPWVAKYELEEYKSASISGQTCDNTVGQANKSFLSPTYINTLPEDPQHPLRLTDIGAGKCELATTTGGLPAGYGQYVYASLMSDENDRPGQYYLMARLERPTHVSENLFTISEQKYPLTVTAINSWGNNYCYQQSPDPNGANCTYNYYLKNSNND